MATALEITPSRFRSATPVLCPFSPLDAGDWGVCYNVVNLEAIAIKT